MKISNISLNSINLSRPSENQISPLKTNPQVVQNYVNLQSSQYINASNNIAFHGLFGLDKNHKSSPEEKLNSAIQNLDNKSIVIFSDDFEKAKALLAQQIYNIKFPMENIYFVKNTINNGSFAVYKDYKDNGKYKIFKLHPLEMVKVLEGGTDENDRKNCK